MLINAKNEFISHVGDRSILCAKVSVKQSNKIIHAYLPLICSVEKYNLFMCAIDLYYNHFDDNPVNGLIWYTDGSWSERDTDEDDGEDGHSFWRYHMRPEIPECLQGRG